MRKGAAPLEAAVWPSGDGEAASAADASDRQVVFSQLHVEMARNATGDFNPFHDPFRWRRVRHNRFGAPIVLGFQLEMLLLQTALDGLGVEPASLGKELPGEYASFRFTFADVVKVGEKVVAEARFSRSESGVRSRLILRKGGRPAVSGRMNCGQERPAALQLDFRPPPELFDLPDGARLAGGRHFLKHRLLQMSDAKNFLAGSLVPSARYFDELEGKARFPALFPLALISSALLEKAAAEGYDFLEKPLVYTSHRFDMDLFLLREARDGTPLHLLVEETGHRSGGRDRNHSSYRCLGLFSGGRPLFAAEIRLASLQA